MELRTTHNINNLSIQKDLLLKNIQSMNASVIKLIRMCKNNKKLLNDAKREELELLFVQTNVLQELSKKMCEKMNKLYNERKKVKQWLNQFHVQDVPACTNEYNDLDFNSKFLNILLFLINNVTKKTNEYNKLTPSFFSFSLFRFIYIHIFRFFLYIVFR